MGVVDAALVGRDVVFKFSLLVQVFSNVHRIMCIRGGLKKSR